MVYVMLADGFEEIEALSVVDVLRRANIDVCTVSISDSKTVTGAHKISVVSDILISDADLNNADMVVLPGGMPGTTNLDNNDILQEGLSFRVKNTKWIAAICAAPMILGKKGYLKGLEAVCFPGFEKDLIGATIKNENVVISENFITSKGPGTALDFALAIVSVLKDKDIAKEIKSSMQISN
ncbi:MAG: DJ-1/PfpI family protein [Clostridiaceae bacterium]|jgi:4-methyl-5(b-hydroxyethyl)-thiazole monophosphate biosynthesis|nr:DJ-1/PfpI family protein [Clostridiaceae bacterium]